MITEQWTAFLPERLRPVLEAAMLAAVGDRAAPDIAGVGIATDPDAAGIEAFANTVDNQTRSVELSPDTPVDQRWNIGTWDLEAPSPDPLGAIREELRAFGDSLSPGGYSRFRPIVWEAIATALAASHDAGFFDRWPMAIRVFQPLDSSASDHDLYRWNSAINPMDADPDLRYFFQVGDMHEFATASTPSAERDDDESLPTFDDLLAVLGRPLSSTEFLRVATPFADALDSESYDDGDGYVSAPSAGIAMLFHHGTARAVFLYAQPDEQFLRYEGFDHLIDGIAGIPSQEDASTRFGAPIMSAGDAHLFAVGKRFMTVETTGGETRLVTLMLESPVA